MPGMKAALLTGSEKVTFWSPSREASCFRWLSAKTRRRKDHRDKDQSLEDRDKDQSREDRDKDQSHDNSEGHSRLEHRTIATAGQGLMILVCGASV